MNYFIEKPEFIKVSLTNICNFRCTMCYNPDLKGQRGFIEKDLFAGIIEQSKGAGIAKLSLGATGEPLLHNKFLEFFELAKSSGLWVSTTTNCVLLKRDIADQLVGLGLDRINLSVYSSSPEEHRQYTGTDTFDQVVENIRYFFDLIQRANSRMIVNFRFLQIPGVNDYNKFKKFWMPIVGQIVKKIPIKKTINWSGLKQGTQFSDHDRICCPHVRYYLHILHNGDVLPCCNIPESENQREVYFGNIKKDNIMDIWRGERYLAFKRDHYSKKVSAYGPCTRCSDIYSAKQNIFARIANKLTSGPI